MKKIRKVWMALPAALLVVLAYNTGAAWQQEPVQDGFSDTTASAPIDTTEVASITATAVPLGAEVANDKFDWLPVTSIEGDTLYYTISRIVKKVSLKTGKLSIDQPLSAYLLFSRNATEPGYITFKNNHFYHDNGRFVFKLKRDGSIAQRYAVPGKVDDFLLLPDDGLLVSDAIGYHWLDKSGDKIAYQFDEVSEMTYVRRAGNGLFENDILYAPGQAGDIEKDSLVYPTSDLIPVALYANTKYVFVVRYYDQSKILVYSRGQQPRLVASVNLGNYLSTPSRNEEEEVWAESIPLAITEVNGKYYASLLKNNRLTLLDFSL